MKTGEAAKAMGVDGGTIRNWIDNEELEKFFSEGARGDHGGPHRVLSEEDVLVLNTIRHLRTTGMAEWQDIADRLDSGFRYQEFPQNAISADPRLIPIPQAEQAAKYLATVAERDSALARVEELEKALAEREAEIKELREKYMQDRLDDQRKSNADIRNLERDIGRLQMQVEMLQKQIEYSQKPADGKREGDE